MTASIIIRTYNEAAKIRDCLTAVCAQEAPFDFEIIVVDSESTDETRAIADAFPVRTITISKDEFTFGRALNIGCREASGEYLVFLSGHSIPASPTWLRNLVGGFTESSIAGVYGPQVPHQECNPLERRLLLTEWPRERKIQHDDPFFSNANSAVRRSSWERYSFHETLPYAEDREWAMRIQCNGHRVSFEPSAPVFHSHNDTLRQHIARRRKEMQALAALHGRQLFREHARMYRLAIHKDFSFLRKNREPFHWYIRALAQNTALIIIAYLHSLETLVRR